MQISSTTPFVTTGAYAKIGTMEHKNDVSKVGSDESRFEQSQFDHAQLEEVMDHHQHLSQMHDDDQYLEEKMVVQSGKGTRVNMEKVESRFKEEPDKFTTNEVVKTELMAVTLRGIVVDTRNAEMLTRLLRGKDCWLSLFRAEPAYEVRASATDRNAVTLVPARQSLIKYVEEVLQALGMHIKPVLESFTMRYTIDSMMLATQQFQDVVNAILEDWNQIVQTHAASRKVNHRPPYPAEPPRGPAVASSTMVDPTEYEETRLQPRTYVPVEAIPPFSRGFASDAESWLKKFLYVANQAGWDNKMRCETFEFKMEGHASYWHTALPSDVQKTWNKLVNAFKNNYSVGLQSPQERYWSASR